MISVQNLSIHFGGIFLFEDVSFALKENDRVGLVGKNGAGKSTLMKIMSGLQKPDSGQVVLPKDSLIGFLHQDLSKMKGKTVFEETQTAFNEALQLDQRMHEIEHELTVRTDYESDSYHDIINEIQEISHRLEIINVATIEKQIELVLMGLGFMREDFDKPVETFSGGWQMRIELAKILLSKPELVLLDEPTNHLDMRFSHPEEQWSLHVELSTAAAARVGFERLDVRSDHTISLRRNAIGFDTSYASCSIDLLFASPKDYLVGLLALHAQDH